MLGCTTTQAWYASTECHGCVKAEGTQVRCHKPTPIHTLLHCSVPTVAAVKASHVQLMRFPRFFSFHSCQFFSSIVLSILVKCYPLSAGIWIPCRPTYQPPITSAASNLCATSATAAMAAALTAVWLDSTCGAAKRATRSAYSTEGGRAKVRCVQQHSANPMLQAARWYTHIATYASFTVDSVLGGTRHI